MSQGSPPRMEIVKLFPAESRLWHGLPQNVSWVVYDLFREFSQPTLKHRSLFCCLSAREQIPERLTTLLALEHPDVPLLAPHLLMKALQEVRRPDEPPERLGKRDRQVG